MRSSPAISLALVAMLAAACGSTHKSSSSSPAPAPNASASKPAAPAPTPGPTGASDDTAKDDTPIATASPAPGQPLPPPAAASYDTRYVTYRCVSQAAFHVDGTQTTYELEFANPECAVGYDVAPAGTPANQDNVKGHAIEAPASALGKLQAKGDATITPMSADPSRKYYTPAGLIADARLPVGTLKTCYAVEIALPYKPSEASPTQFARMSFNSLGLDESGRTLYLDEVEQTSMPTWDQVTSADLQEKLTFYVHCTWQHPTTQPLVTIVPAA